jgi:hypothetical protein
MARKRLTTPTHLYLEGRDRPLRCMCGGIVFRLRNCDCEGDGSCDVMMARCEFCHETHQVGLMPEQRPVPVPAKA